MTAVIETEELGKQYRGRWALAGCTLSIPAGHVVGLVGPNGAGKTTLLNLATGELAPSAGTIEVLGNRPAAGSAQLARVGYLAQDAPLYAGLPVADHLRLGAHLNPGWNAKLARARIERLDLDLRQKAGTLSGGQRAQLALTLATAKRPELLILDEPVASLDPLARREFLQDLMETVGEQQVGRQARSPQRPPSPGGAEMIWLTWRQFRVQAITAAAALAVFAIVLAATASDLSGMYNNSGLLTCHGAACSGLASTFLSNLASDGGGFVIPGSPYAILYFLSVLVILIAPAITGVFWGAPLIARELETGTFRLTWNQSITRTRWLTVKLTLIGVAAMAVTEAFSLIQAWWAAPIGKAVGLGGGASIFSEGRFGWFVFPTHGITPLGYAAFGFALGVTTGLVIRRAIPAMAITLAIFAAVQFITPLWIRPQLFPTSHTIAAIAATGANVSLRTNPKLVVTASVVPGQPGAWIISSAGVNAAGQPVSTIPAACEPAISDAMGSHPGSAAGPGSAALNNCVASHGIRVAESYQPASHYWPLQWSETGMFLVVALALAGYCFWRLNRRRT